MRFGITIESLSFWIAFFLLFLIGGFLAFIGLPFRPFLAILLVVPLVLFQKIEIDKIFFLYLVLMLEILFSGLINYTGITKPILFSRFLITSYLTYLIAYNYISNPIKEKLFKICLIIGLIQFPVVLIQRSFYDQIIRFSRVEISYWDIGSGTFFIKDDPAMTIFLIGLVLILLFEKSIQIRYKPLVTIILLATIFVAQSRILQLVTIIIITVYFLKDFSFKKIVYVLLFGLFGILILTQTKIYTEIKGQITKAYVQATFQDSGNLEAFKSGKYSRNAAVLYYLNQPIKWFGDGPGTYFDVTSRERLVGNTGQVFTFYSEVGIIGLLLSYLILYQMSRSCQNRLIGILYFFTIMMLSITSNVLSDASIVLAYIIFLFIPSKPDMTDDRIQKTI